MQYGSKADKDSMRWACVGSPSQVRLLAHRLNDGPGGVDCGLGGVDGAHDVGVGGRVQTKGSGDPWDLSGGQHQAQTEQRVVLEYHEARNEDDGLQKRRQAETGDLFAPLVEAVLVAPRLYWAVVEWLAYSYFPPPPQSLQVPYRRCWVVL